MLGGIIAGAAMIGLNGVIAYRANSRTHEIRVRIALGADRRTIIQLVFADVFYVAGAGRVIGAIASVLLLAVARRAVRRFRTRSDTRGCRSSR